MSALPSEERPGAPALRLVRVPRLTVATQSDVPDRAQGTLGLELVRSAPGVPRPAASVWRGDDEDEPAAAPDQSRLPEPRRWTAMIAQALVEILAGRRPPAQVVRWVEPEIYDRIRRSVARRPTGQPGTPVRVRRVHVSTDIEGTVDAVAVVDDGTRCRAMALRLEALERRWVCTALDVV